MIQDIEPKHLDNQYKDISPKPEDIILFYEGTSILAGKKEEKIFYPNYKEFSQNMNEENFSMIYAFCVDDINYFLAIKKGEISKEFINNEMLDSNIHSEYKDKIDGYEFMGINFFRHAVPKYRAFAAITGYHIYSWYRDNRFCGRCGSLLIHDKNERMVKCEKCNNVIYPKICPAVIIGVTDKDRILLTKYAGRTYKNYALIAGFNEVGETFEDTVHREVFEEAGLHVKNIRYYKSQPWAPSGSLLAGFFCDLDGDDTIRLQEDELSVGKWVKAEDIDLEDDDISLTREMILKFKSDMLK